VSGGGGNNGRARLANPSVVESVVALLGGGQSNLEYSDSLVCGLRFLPELAGESEVSSPHHLELAASAQFGAVLDDVLAHVDVRPLANVVSYSPVAGGFGIGQPLLVGCNCLSVPGLASTPGSADDVRTGRGFGILTLG